tara:strand:+ start:145 stop:528 length:384 start_codon:yes stop_codon:yes gene_type:complete
LSSSQKKEREDSGYERIKKMISHALEKKESSNTNTKSSFFSSIVAFCRQNCSALLSKEEERSPSFLFSLSLSVSFPRFVVSREETVREEKEKEKEAGRRLLPVLVKSLGDTRDSDWISQSRLLVFSL